ncbi:hypothetical protein CpipJ_CPIJ020139 [Culex quinquefasciatus]|uniref:Chitin-binding type-2 domain-containing protein n=1 Tax=Culex quinquefasciatus TaxID=7176 RepID=B0XLN6_CULQU|nr:hypothetical protein CpipJ_CPIJ020139 [Culex quinquefasciatus]|eukprot:XP_001870558.1 hypothetical protein CpipJ_CPIJ020139 [Culex quinquefasciatus]
MKFVLAICLLALFSVATVAQAVFQCQAEGLYQDSAEPTTYYQCAADLTYRVLSCPVDAVMPKDLMLCAEPFW